MSPVELVAELHRRQGEMYAGGAVDPVVELLAEDIVWHVPGRSPIAGDHRGTAAVVEYFESAAARRGDDASRRGDREGDAVAVRHGTAVWRREVSWQTIGATASTRARRIQEVWLVPLDADLFDRIWSSGELAPIGGQVATRSPTAVST